MDDSNTEQNIIKLILINLTCLILLIIVLNSTIIQTNYTEDGEEGPSFKWHITSIISPDSEITSDIEYSIFCNTGAGFSSSDVSLFCDFEKSGDVLKTTIYSAIIISIFSLFYLFSLFQKMDIFSEKTIHYLDKYVFAIPPILLIIGNIIWLIMSPSSSEINSFLAVDSGEPFSNFKTFFTFGFYIYYVVIFVNLYLFFQNKNLNISRYWELRNKNIGKTPKEIQEQPFDNLQVKLEKINNLFSEGIISESERDKLRESEISKII